MTHTLQKGDIVWHKLHNRKGTVHARPRAHSTAVQLILEGNSSPQYYDLADLLRGDQHGPSVLSESPVGSAAPAPVMPPGLDLRQLQAVQRDLHARLELLDDTIWQLRLQHLVGVIVEQSRPAPPPAMLPVVASPTLSGDAEKIQRDTATALAAARRLFPSSKVQA